MPVYRVVDWDRNFENNRTRELKRLDWVPFPNKHDGDGYTELLDHEDGAAHYGAWCAIVQVASKCDPRGTLLRDGARPHDARSLARMTRIDEGIMSEAIIRLVTTVKWLEVVADPPVTTTSQGGAGLSQGGAGKRLGNGSEGNGREANGTEGNLTGDRKPLGNLESIRKDLSPPSPLDSGAGEGEQTPLDLSGVDWDRVIVMAEKVAARIPPLSSDDRRFWLKYAVLAEHRFSEHWLMDSVEAVLQAKETRKTRQAHLMAVVKSKALDDGIDQATWKAVLKRIEIPDHVWKDVGVLEVKA